VENISHTGKEKKALGRGPEGRDARQHGGREVCLSDKKGKKRGSPNSSGGSQKKVKKRREITFQTRVFSRGKRKNGKFSDRDKKRGRLLLLGQDNGKKKLGLVIGGAKTFRLVRKRTSLRKCEAIDHGRQPKNPNSLKKKKGGRAWSEFNQER